MVAQNIDVVKTFESVVSNPHSIHALLCAIEDEAMGRPFEDLPENPLDVVAWMFRLDPRRRLALDPDSFSPTVLTPFTLLNQEEQKKILLRAHRLCLRMYPHRASRFRLVVSA